MILLTATALVILFGSRIRALRAAEAAARYSRIYQGETEPEETAKPALHFSNPFQTPVLFCAASLLTLSHSSPVSQPVGLRGRTDRACMHRWPRDPTGPTDQRVLCRVARVDRALDQRLASSWRSRASRRPSARGACRG